MFSWNKKDVKLEDFMVRLLKKKSPEETKRLFTREYVLWNQGGLAFMPRVATYFRTNPPMLTMTSDSGILVETYRNLSFEQSTMVMLLDDLYQNQRNSESYLAVRAATHTDVPNILDCAQAMYLAHFNGNNGWTVDSEGRPNGSFVLKTKKIFPDFSQYNWGLMLGGDDAMSRTQFHLDTGPLNVLRKYLHGHQKRLTVICECKSASEALSIEAYIADTIVEFDNPVKFILTGLPKSDFPLVFRKFRLKNTAIYTEYGKNMVITNIGV